MASGNFVIDKGFNAAAAITKFRAVKLSAAETVTPVTAVGDLAIGVAQFSVTAPEIAKGKGASVRLLGITELEASGAVAVGDLVAMAADGRAKTGAPAAGDRILGIALKAAANAGDRITLFLTPARLFTTGS
jgi:hypothetical protein